MSWWRRRTAVFGCSASNTRLTSSMSILEYRRAWEVVPA
jgi:hypothetical protein